MSMAFLSNPDAQYADMHLIAPPWAGLGVTHWHGQCAPLEANFNNE